MAKKSIVLNKSNKKISLEQMSSCSTVRLFCGPERFRL